MYIVPSLCWHMGQTRGKKKTSNDYTYYTEVCSVDIFRLSLG